MFFQLHLFTLLIAPVMAYLAAALMFSLLTKRDEEQSLPISASNVRFRDGQNL